MARVSKLPPDDELLLLIVELQAEEDRLARLRAQTERAETLKTESLAAIKARADALGFSDDQILAALDARRRLDGSQPFLPYLTIPKPLAQRKPLRTEVPTPVRPRLRQQAHFGPINDGSSILTLLRAYFAARRLT